jgi:hypothetical protein
MSDADINREGLGDAREAVAEQRSRMPRAYTRTAPDPERAAREREFVRTRNQQEYPTWQRAIDSVLAADLPLDDAADALMRLRVRNSRIRVRTARNARTRATR